MKNPEKNGQPYKQKHPKMVKERLLREFSPKLHFLFEPHRYKVAYSGRAAGKSWSFAAALLQIGAERPLRIVCARETMRSIADSVHKLLVDQIKRLNLTSFYEVTQSKIRGTNGTEIFFAGLRNNIDNIKSIESCDIVWVEEGQEVSKDSWEVLIQTIHKEGSEIWCSFSVDIAESDTYQRWVLNPPKNTKIVFMNWRDNRYLTEAMKLEIEHLRETDPEDYEYVYEGVLRTGAMCAG